MFQKKSFIAEVGAHSTMDSILALHPAASGLILGVPKNCSLREILSLCCRDLLMALLRTVGRGLIMSIKPI